MILRTPCRGVRCVLFTEDAVVDQRKTRVAKLYPGMALDVIDRIVELDPSRDKRYSVWLARCVSRATIRLPEDADRVTAALQAFAGLRDRNLLTGTSADIMRYTSLASLEEKVEELSGTKTKGEEYRGKLETGVEVIHSDPVYQILKISNAESAAKMLRHTSYCVKDPRWASDYLKAGAFYLVTRDGKPLMLVHGASHQAKFINDKPVTQQSLQTIHSILHKLPFGVLLGDHRKVSGVKLDQDVDFDAGSSVGVATQWALQYKRRVPDAALEEKILAGETALDYLAAITSDPNIEIPDSLWRMRINVPQDVVTLLRFRHQKAPVSAYKQAIKAMAGAGHDGMAMSDLWSPGFTMLMNAAIVSGTRWPELEQMMVGRHGLPLYDYVTKAVKEPDDTLGRILLKINPLTASVYGKRFFKGKTWPELIEAFRDAARQAVNGDTETRHYVFEWLRYAMDTDVPISDDDLNLISRAIASCHDPGGLKMLVDYAEKLGVKLPAATEEVLLRGFPSAAISYMQRVRKAPWPELHASLVHGKKRSALAAYVKAVAGFPAGAKQQKQLASGNPRAALVIAQKAGKAQPHLEDVIAKSAVASYNYALLIERRFPKGEPAILKSADLMMPYAARLIGNSWPEAERYWESVNFRGIAPQDLIMYAGLVKKDRWKAMEDALLANGELGMMAWGAAAKYVRAYVQAAHIREWPELRQAIVAREAQWMKPGEKSEAEQQYRSMMRRK